MSYTLKFIIPIALGILAAVVNMMVLNAKLEPMQFIQVTRDIPQGELITKGDLEVLELPGPVGAKLTDTALGYQELGVLINRSAQRDFMQGDIVFYRDFAIRGAELDLRPGETAQRLSLAGVSVPAELLRIGCELDFLLKVGEEAKAEWYGPFRLVSVGERLGNTNDSSVTSSTSNTITVAVVRSPTDPAVIRRQEALDAFAVQQQTESASVLSVRISPDRF